MQTKASSTAQTASVRRELLHKNIVISLTVMVVLAACLSLLFYHAQRAQNILNVQAANASLNHLMQSAFQDAHDTVRFLAQQSVVRNYDTRKPGAQRDLLTLFRSVGNSNHRVKYIYAGYAADKSLKINDYSPPKGFDPTTRPWYIKALEARPQAVVGEMYREAKSGEWLISTSQVLINDAGQVAGVVAFDMNLDFIEELLTAQHEIFELSHSFIMHKNGKIGFHHDKSLIGRNINEITTLDFKRDFPQDGGSFVYKYGSRSRLGFYSFLPGSDWIVATVMDEGTVFWAYAWQAGLCFVLVLLAAVAMSLWVSRTTGRRFVEPLVLLNDQVERLAKGEEAGLSIREYPNNEIGQLAEHVGQLAEQELLAKTHALTSVNQKLASVNAELETEKIKFEHMSNTDQLTSLHNRRCLDHVLLQELARFKRYGEAFTVLMLDVDHFKHVNDQDGHVVGDQVLFQIAEELRRCVRDSDILGRWGGEEFMVLCPKTDLAGGYALAEKIRTTVEAADFACSLGVTVSIGVGEVMKDQNAVELIRQVDQNLYRAKQSGRNRCVALSS